MSFLLIPLLPVPSQVPSLRAHVHRKWAHLSERSRDAIYAKALVVGGDIGSHEYDDIEMVSEFKEELLTILEKDSDESLVSGVTSVAEDAVVGGSENQNVTGSTSRNLMGMSTSSCFEDTPGIEAGLDLLVGISKSKKKALLVEVLKLLSNKLGPNHKRGWRLLKALMELFPGFVECLSSDCKTIDGKLAHDLVMWLQNVKMGAKHCEESFMPQLKALPTWLEAVRQGKGFIEGSYGTVTSLNAFWAVLGNGGYNAMFKLPSKTPEGKGKMMMAEAVSKLDDSTLMALMIPLVIKQTTTRVIKVLGGPGAVPGLRIESSNRLLLEAGTSYGEISLNCSSLEDVYRMAKQGVDNMKAADVYDVFTGNISQIKPYGPRLTTRTNGSVGGIKWGPVIAVNFQGKSSMGSEDLSGMDRMLGEDQDMDSMEQATFGKRVVRRKSWNAASQMEDEKKGHGSSAAKRMKVEKDSGQRGLADFKGWGSPSVIELDQEESQGEEEQEWRSRSRKETGGYGSRDVGRERGREDEGGHREFTPDWQRGRVEREPGSRKSSLQYNDLEEQFVDEKEWDRLQNSSSRGMSKGWEYRDRSRGVPFDTRQPDPYDSGRNKGQPTRSGSPLEQVRYSSPFDRVRSSSPAGQERPEGGKFVEPRGGSGIVQRSGGKGSHRSGAPMYPGPPSVDRIEQRDVDRNRFTGGGSGSRDDRGRAQNQDYRGDMRRHGH